MLTALKLGNFKGFAETQTIPLRPLTLIFGANSSGKSTLIHGLLLAHEANRTGSFDVRRTQLGGDSVDLGGFRQFVHRRASDIEVEWGVEISVDGTSEGRAALLAGARQVSFLGRFDPSLHSYEIDIDGVRFITTGAAVRVHHKHPAVLQALGLSPQPQPRPRGRARSKKGALEGALSGTALDFVRSTRDFETFLPKGLSNDDQGPAMRTASAPSQRASSAGNELQQTALSSLPSLVDATIQGVSARISTELDRLTYLGPLRSYPPRHLAYDQPDDPNWVAGGGQAYEVLRQNPRVREDVNKWLDKLSILYQLKVEHLWTSRDLDQRSVIDAMTEAVTALAKRSPTIDENFRERVREELENQLSVIEIEETDAEWEFGHDASHLWMMSLLDKRTNTLVSHRDVGIGVSQVLPVLVNASASEGRIVAIEQPEIHLHPALQANLADVFIESALGQRKNTFILETHSEHLILRVLRRIRETTEGRLPDGAMPVTPDQVSVIYVEPTSDGAKVLRLRVDESGEFIDRWPHGFFEEREDDLF